MLPLSGSVRLRVRALAVALLAALPVALLPAATARAEDRTVRGGRLDWGIKSSFQSYVTGPIAHGNFSLTGGAATVGGSQFRFHSARGSYDPATGAFEAAFGGGVHFTGHRKPDGGNELDLTISRPRVRISGGSGTLYADMVSRARGSGRFTTTSQVPFASLNLSGIDMRGGGSPVALSTVPAALTADGAKAFAGYYTAGTALDPVSLSVDVTAPAGPSSSAPSPSSTAGPSASAAASASASPGTSGSAAPGAFRDAAVDWGVRRTFREYVTGAIARGEWTLAGGAQDGGALFRFPRGTGAYDAKSGVLDARFTGSVRFTGKQLDLTLAAVAVRVKDGKGTLSADVTGGGRTEKAVPLVTFTAGDFTPKNGLAVITEAPAVLTAPGARAFGSLYRAGTAMDPVSLAVATDARAALPALPDLGSDTTASPAATGPSTTASPAAPASAPAASGSSAVPVAACVAGGAGVLALAALAAYLVRRRRTPAPATETDGPGTATTTDDTGTGTAG
ncbi:HtaA domain-containing protein [Streptomyces sp. LP05-1]|uniref:HtaA domain-containing protein n=1 Tax=Streptomyces pyxinae TaxID=2970734 RepID=A0ABT2CNX1_9ACTN|nr:HtaA domain-containing protein [Streptomyces sp. LP05-1]MCS0638946.1 HtaA domain-containing protein [Streptomyces sp. LP05-1]